MFDRFAIIPFFRGKKMTIKFLLNMILIYIGHLSLMISLYFYSNHCSNRKIAGIFRYTSMISLAISGIFIMYLGFNIMQ